MEGEELKTNKLGVSQQQQETTPNINSILTLLVKVLVFSYCNISKVRFIANYILYQPCLPEDPD